MEFASAHANRSARRPKRGLEIKTGAEPLHGAGWNIRLRDMAGKIYEISNDLITLNIGHFQLK